MSTPFFHRLDVDVARLALDWALFTTRSTRSMMGAASPGAPSKPATGFETPLLRDAGASAVSPVGTLDDRPALALPRGAAVLGHRENIRRRSAAWWRMSALCSG